MHVILKYVDVGLQLTPLRLEVSYNVTAVFKKESKTIGVGDGGSPPPKKKSGKNIFRVITV